MIKQSMVSYAVRLAEQSDHASVGDLLVRVYVGEGFSSPESADSLVDVAKRVASAELLVAAQETLVLGAVFVVMDGPLRQIARPEEAELRTLAVEPSARRSGVGESLVRAAMARAAGHGCQGLALSTQPTMTAAQRLYEKIGFQRVSERDWVRPNGTPMLAYARRLDPSGGPSEPAGTVRT